MTKFHLFPTVREFYTDMQKALQAAERTIHMAYYAFDDGHWARAIGHTIAQRAAAGVTVQLLIDEAGLYLDNARHGWRNRTLLSHLRASGVHVGLFRPQGQRLSQFNRLHCKFCAIDDHTAFIGGSNIGDHYLGWRDCNLRLTGSLGPGFARLHASLRRFGGENSRKVQADCRGDLLIDDMPLLLTTPGRRQDIRRRLLELILAADTAVTLRSWYFLPDQEIMNALLTQAENGVRVTILLSTAPASRSSISPTGLFAAVCGLPACASSAIKRHICMRRRRGMIKVTSFSGRPTSTVGRCAPTSSAASTSIIRN